MEDVFRNIRAVGFDLDGTLYAQTPQMDEEIADLIAAKILLKLPELKDLANAKEFSEKKYREFESRKKTLESVGYTNAGEIMEEVFRAADNARFLTKDERLVDLLKEIKKAKEYVYIITTAPEAEAKKKLGKLGVGETIFDIIICGDHPLIAQKPKDEIIFRHVVELSGIPAENHVYIGDREKSDIRAPQSIRMKAIAVGNDIAHADAYAARIYDIKTILL
jgi:HAD superfamily hydrolase (TIGR01549 family)